MQSKFLNIDSIKTYGMTLFQVPSLKGSNFDNWSIKMKAFYGAHDVWEVIKKGYNEPDKAFLIQQ